MAKYENLGKGFIKPDKWIDTPYSDITKPVNDNASDQ